MLNNIARRKRPPKSHLYCLFVMYVSFGEEKKNQKIIKYFKIYCIKLLNQSLKLIIIIRFENEIDLHEATDLS